MPKVVFLMGWDRVFGPRLIGQYPPDYPLDKDRLLDIFGLAIRKGDAAHFAEIELKGENAIVYFTGMQTRMSLGVILSEDDKPDSVRGALTRIVIDLIVRGTLPASVDEWRNIYDKISIFASMSLEERIGELLSDSNYKEIFEHILEEGVITYDQLLVKMNVLTGTKQEELIRAYLEIMESLGVIQKYRDEEAVREYIYLLKDVVILRKKPPMYDLISDEIPDYEDEYEKFVEVYLSNKEWQVEQDILAYAFSNPTLYSLLRRFRDEGIIRKDALSGLENYVDFLLDTKVCKEYKEHYYMFTDIAIVIMFPKYSIHKALAKYSAGELTLEETKRYLEAVKKAYL